MKYSLKIEIEKGIEDVKLLFGNEANRVSWQPGSMGMAEIGGETSLGYPHGRRVITMIE